MTAPPLLPTMVAHGVVLAVFFVVQRRQDAYKRRFSSYRAVLMSGLTRSELGSNVRKRGVGGRALGVGGGVVGGHA
jgi:hypothetical protein